MQYQGRAHGQGRSQHFYGECVAQSRISHVKWRVEECRYFAFWQACRTVLSICYVQDRRFHTDESDLIVQDVIEGNIIQMASRVVDTLRTKYLLSPIHYEGLQRVEQLEVPEKALRELIYNSIAHKDYSGPAIQMRIYDRSIELWNYGLLPQELTPADLLKKHSSYPRNHNIATVFYKAGFVESWGRGYKKIAEEFEHAKMPLPTIEETGGGVMAIIQRETMDKVIAKRGANVGDMSETCRR